LLKKILSQPVLRIWFFIEIFGLILMVAAHLLGGRYLTLAAFIFMVAVHILILFLSKTRIYNFFEKTQIEGKDTWGLMLSAQKYAKLAGIPCPEVYLLDVSAALSFSFSNQTQSSAIFLSETLVEDLNARELEALIAFETARISLGQSFAAVIASSAGFVLNLLTGFIDRYVFMQFLFSEAKRKHIAEIFMTPFVTAFCWFLIRKEQTLRADELAGQWMQNKKILAITLWKLESLVNTGPTKLRLCDSYLFTINPLTNRRWSRYLSLQASVRQRIRNLVGHYPI